MKLIHRIGYYLGGFSIGLIFLAFFLSGKRASCSYGPDARALKNISTKQLNYSPNVLEAMNSKSIDSLAISKILKSGDVDFSKVNRNLDSCNIYIIEHEIKDKNIALTVENCEAIATIKTIRIK